MGEMRQFDTGATRDTNANKLDYEGFLNPLVLQRYAQYLDKHRVQSDGKLRDSDNWQRGIPVKEYMKSKLRHTVATWLLHRGYPAYDERGNIIDIENSLCAEIFNASGHLFEILREKLIQPVQQVQQVQTIKLIYCDMDGVLCDFMNAMAIALGLEDRISKKQFEYNWFEDKREEADKIATAEFWACLKWTKEGKAIFEKLCESLLSGYTHVFFLTTPMRNKCAAIKGKEQWLKNEFQGISKFIRWQEPIITIASKALFAAPTSLLIDDKDENVEEFRAAGGHAILIARPWNSRWQETDRCLELFKKDLEKYSFSTDKTV